MADIAAVQGKASWLKPRLVFNRKHHERTARCHLES